MSSLRITSPSSALWSSLLIRRQLHLAPPFLVEDYEPAAVKAHRNGLLQQKVPICQHLIITNLIISRIVMLLSYSSELFRLFPSQNKRLECTRAVPNAHSTIDVLDRLQPELALLISGLVRAVCAVLVQIVPARLRRGPHERQEGRMQHRQEGHRQRRVPALRGGVRAAGGHVLE